MDFARRARKEHFFGHLVVLFLVNCLAQKKPLWVNPKQSPKSNKQHNQTTNKWMKMNVKHPLGSHNSKQCFSSNKSCSFFFEKKYWENIGNFGLYSVNWTDFSFFLGAENSPNLLYQFFLK